MARGRIFSSRRMFSSRQPVFAGGPRRSPGRLFGLALAALIVFAAGFYAGRTYPELLDGALSTLPAPLAAAEF